MHVADQVNILLVDDQPAKLLTLRGHARASSGENLIKASSGREALEHLLKHEITVVLMDVSMPDLDGFELAEIIREHPALPEDRDHLRLRGAPHRHGPAQGLRLRGGRLRGGAGPAPSCSAPRSASSPSSAGKTLEAERLARELERRVSERTAELEASTARLRELADELRAADRRKDEFLALLAHELRNPLAPGAQRRQHHARAAVSTIPISSGAATSSSARPPADPAGGRPARRVAHQPRQDPAAPRAGRAVGHRPRRRRDQPAARRRPAARAAHQPAAASRSGCMAIPRG